MVTRVKITGLGRNFIRNQVISIQDLSDRQVKAIADETVIVIRREITARIEREGSTGNLANSFFAFPITGGHGVGDIEFLNQNAKYWYWQNFGIALSGRSIPPSTAEFPRNRGSFNGQAPQAGGGTSRWGKGVFPITPTKPIEAKNYIQATVSQVNQIVASAIRRVRL